MLRIVGLGLALGTCCQIAVAQPAKQEPVKGAPLMAVVGDGVFEMRPGKSIDLTKKGVLLTFAREWNMEIFVKISGAEHRMTVGDRLDLMRLERTRDVMQGRDSCFLDLVDVTLPKGAPAVATFRFNCI